MDLNGLFKAVEASKGVPTKSLFREIDQGRVCGTLKKPSLSHFLKAINSRPPIEFPEVQFDQFNYLPLPTPTSICILRVGPKDENGLLRCLLDTVDLNDEPLYNCLSNTWVRRSLAFFYVFPTLNKATLSQRKLCGPSLMKSSRNMVQTQRGLSPSTTTSSMSPKTWTMRRRRCLDTLGLT